MDEEKRGWWNGWGKEMMKKWMRKRKDEGMDDEKGGWDNEAQNEEKEWNQRNISTNKQEWNQTEEERNIKRRKEKGKERWKKERELVRKKKTITMTIQRKKRHNIKWRKVSSPEYDEGKTNNKYKTEKKKNNDQECEDEKKKN